VDVVIAGIAGDAAAQGPSGGPPWGQDAEKEFRARPRDGSEMRTLKGEDRERYRLEMHDKMRERAKERGIAMPAEPGPHGRGGPGGPPPQR
jgi:hypothetical protein